MVSETPAKVWPSGVMAMASELLPPGRISDVNAVWPDLHMKARAAVPLVPKTVFVSSETAKIPPGTSWAASGNWNGGRPAPMGHAVQRLLVLGPQLPPR